MYCYVLKLHFLTPQSYFPNQLRSPCLTPDLSELSHYVGFFLEKRDLHIKFLKRVISGWNFDFVLNYLILFFSSGKKIAQHPLHLSTLSQIEVCILYTCVLKVSLLELYYTFIFVNK